MSLVFGLHMLLDCSARYAIGAGASYLSHGRGRAMRLAWQAAKFWS